MTEALKKTKEDIKKIERYCERPIPSVKELDLFIKSNGLEDYELFANSYLQAVTQKEWHFYQKKINKSR